MLNSFINNGVKIYSLSSGQFNPNTSKIGEKKKQNGKKKGDYQGIEILNDLEFSEKSDQIKISADGRYICISGMYPPQVGIYDTLQMSIKERRHFDEEIVDMEFLTTNYEKIVFLQKCRNIEFHKAGGKYYKMRIPKEGRKLTYHRETANLYICTSSEEILNLNLHKGCFETSLQTQNESNNFFCKNPELPLYASGGSNGILEMWDMRTKGKITFLKMNGINGSGSGSGSISGNINGSYENNENYNYNGKTSLGIEDSVCDVGELTSCCFSTNGLQIAVGTIKGQVYVYDIRHNRPIFIKDHCNDKPINKIEFLKINNSINNTNSNSTTYNNNNNNNMYRKYREEKNGFDIDVDFDIENNFYNSSECIASCDESGIQIYSEKKNIVVLQLVNYEDNDNSRNKKRVNRLLNNDSINISSFTFYPNSGLCLIPCDNSKVFVYFVPLIGMAPKWCSFLDSITEELEDRENRTSTNYDSYTNDNMLQNEYVFITNEQVDQLNINHLKGTKNLISYLHGYFIPAKVYSDIKSVVDKNSVDDMKKKMIQKQMEQKQRMRIPEKGNITNADYATELLNKISKKKQKKEKVLFEAEQLFKDDRFQKLFSDPDYNVEHIKLEK